MTVTEIEEAAERVRQELGFVFSRPDLLLTALTHTSFSNETPGRICDNQRLEFLGDAVLGLVTAEALMEHLPESEEGQLTARRSLLIREETLAKIARSIGLGQLIRLGRGEEMNNGRDRSSILADASEALIGAIYLDGGYEASRKAVLQWLGSELEKAASGVRPDDAKSTLQEILQSRTGQIPIYEVVGEEGPDHAKVFEVEIHVGKNVLASGRGRSKKAAEKDAARRAINGIEE